MIRTLKSELSILQDLKEEKTEEVFALDNLNIQSAITNICSI